MPKNTKIPDATIERISIYSRPLEKLWEQGTLVISSEQLAKLCKVNPAQVRKDLSHFGEFGVRGIGYGVQDLLMEIKRILVSDREWKLGLVGLGDMGMALLSHENFSKRGYRFAAVFDMDPQRIGETLPTGLIIQAMDQLAPLTQSLGIEVGVIATAPSQAQAVADMFVKAGIKAILNFSPIKLRQPEHCLMENVDFSVRLDNLAYHLSQFD